MVNIDCVFSTLLELYHDAFAFDTSEWCQHNNYRSMKCVVPYALNDWGEKTNCIIKFITFQFILSLIEVVVCSLEINKCISRERKNDQIIFYELRKTNDTPFAHRSHDRVNCVNKCVQFKQKCVIKYK